MAGDYCDVILGMGHDPSLGDKISVTVIATGFNHKEIADVPVKNNEPEKIIVRLGETAPVATVLNTPSAPSAKTDTMAPKLVEMPAATPPVFDIKPAFPTVQQEEKETFTLDMAAPVMEEVVATTTVMPEAQVQPQAQPQMQQQGPVTFELVIKTDEQVKEQTPSAVKIGEHMLTPAEIEERNRFEAQKRALEERAERLRRMSFNIKSAESTDDVESVPAYVRRNVELDDSVASSHVFYSGYSVGVHNDQRNNNQASIQTINTFLDGKKPD